MKKNKIKSYNKLWDYGEKISFKINFKSYFHNWKRITTFDISIAGLLLSLQIIFAFAANFTILRVIPLEIGIVFFIFYGLLLGPFKGSILSFVSDTIIMLMIGQIGTWFYIYALIPPLVALFSSFYIYFFIRLKKTSFLISFLILLSALVIMVVVFLNKNSNGLVQVNYSKTNPRFIASNVLLSMIVVFGLLILFSFIAFAISFRITKNKRLKKYLLVFSLVCLIVIFFRWIIGPLAYIEYYNYLYHYSHKLKTYGSDYQIIMLPMIIKSIFSIPIYTLIVTPIYSVLDYLKTKYIDSRFYTSY